jgi:pimeloyl-ACP methyl ester carboxylesterase
VPSAPAVFAAAARFTRVCKYDRPGTIRYTKPIALTTRSSPVYEPRTLSGMVSDLRTMLMRAGVRGPYVLVAHSYGGLILRLFAQTYPAEAAGLVLVDAFGTDIKPLFGDQWPSYQAILNQPGTELDATPGFETVDADEAIAAVEQAPALPSIPVAVISKTEPFATSPTVPEALRTQLEKVWPQVQGRLVDLGPQTPHIFATGSDHYVQIHEPDLVVSVIRLIFERARAAHDLGGGRYSPESAPARSP